MYERRRAMNPTRIECNEEKEEEKKYPKNLHKFFSTAFGPIAGRYLVRQQSHMQLRN